MTQKTHYKPDRSKPKGKRPWRDARRTSKRFWFE